MQVPVSPEVNMLVDAAAEISVRRSHYFVGVEHLFEAMAHHNNLLPPVFCDQHLKKLMTVCREIDRHGWQGAAVNDHGEVFYTPRLANLLREAARLAGRLGATEPKAGHVLLALLGDAHAAPCRTMDTLRVDRGELITALRRSLGADAKPASRRLTAVETTASTLHSDGEGQAESGSLEAITNDLTQAARDGKLEPAVGRDKELYELLQVLARKSKNNAILLGEAGVGKTKIIEALALAASKGKLNDVMPECRILELNLGALMAGTQYRGAFEQKIIALIDELKQNKNMILFIDEIHLIMGAGSTDGSSVDIANLLKPPLARGDIRCLGATTLAECRKFIEKDPAIERRFQMIRVEPLSEEATYDVLTRLRPSLEKHHGVHISRRAMAAAISLTQRYLPNRQLPDKAIDVLDLACARYRVKGAAIRNKMTAHGEEPIELKNRVSAHHIRTIVSQIAAIPLEQLTADERQRLGDLERRLNKRIIGQHEAVRQVVAAVKKSRAGLGDPNRPEAVMLFLGPTGVGKTQLAKELADSLFGSAEHLITFDMSEYLEAHSVSRLLGAPPGYVGSEEEGRLTGAVRNQPFSILLFDEIEKAHPKVFDIFLPILDEGRLKDLRGQTVSFRNCTIIMTSNIGANCLHRAGDDDRSALLDELRRHFRPEFINRIDDIVPFYSLMFEDVRAILKISVGQLSERLREKGLGIRMYQRAYEYLAEQGYNAEYGARELRRVFDQLVTKPISDMLLDGAVESGDVIEVLREESGLMFRKAKDTKRETAGTA